LGGNRIGMVQTCAIWLYHKSIVIARVGRFLTPIPTMIDTFQPVTRMLTGVSSVIQHKSKRIVSH